MEYLQAFDKGTNGPGLGHLETFSLWNVDLLLFNDGWKKVQTKTYSSIDDLWHLWYCSSSSVASGFKNDQKKHVRPVLQTTISCQSNYSIVKKIKVRLVELRGMPHQLEKSLKLTKTKHKT